MTIKIEQVTTSDGSHTLFLPDLNEHYHSKNGAITESEHVYINAGLLHSKVQNPVIFEAGFGTGLNALLTALESEKNKKHTTYYTIEKYPLEQQVTTLLNYGIVLPAPASHLFQQIHNTAWNTLNTISPFFKIKKIKADLLTFDISQLTFFNIIYFDAFGPDKQPDMWTDELLGKIALNTATDGIFVTYSAKGSVRRSLMNCGFDMEKLPGPPGKNEMLRGIKKLSLT
ncbi:MAG: SAM-dependent methyltransferase [Draconibacterium sp.]|nr:MAG: SAM-dependent methyltransferase [Draconibacterium sp.]PIF05060.1 MAG: SAM-dependent methyltransferase [Draconibacterium sp.]